MSQSTLKPLPPRDAHEADLLRRLYREIGVSAVAAALRMGQNAPETGRSSAVNSEDKARDQTRAA